MFVNLSFSKIPVGLFVSLLGYTQNARNTLRNTSLASYFAAGGSFATFTPFSPPLAPGESLQ